MLDTTNLATRLGYRGGGKQEPRMHNGKLRALRRALIYSYQGCTIELEDGRQFRALINPVKNSEDKDLKQISIPFEDIRLNPESTERKKTSAGREVIGLAPGNVFTWVETGTKWLVYLQYLEEDAYFRANIIRCDQWIEIDNTKYWVHVRSSTATSLDWNIDNNIIRNNPNYTLVMYLTRNQQTDDYFHRFTKIKVGNVENSWEGGEHFKNWEVVGRNPYKGDGVLELYLKEDWSNTIQEEEEAAQAEAAAATEEETPETYIDGPSNVEVYSTFTVSLYNVTDLSGTWAVSNSKAKIISYTEDTATIQVVSGKSGAFNITYGDLTKTVTIDSI